MSGDLGADGVRAGRAARIGLSIAVALVAAVAFLPALAGQFVTWDDNVTLTGNTSFRGFGAVHIRWMFTNTLLGHYMPLTWLSFAVTYALGGMDPRGFHLASLGLNAFNAALVTLRSWRLISAAEAHRTTAAPASRSALTVGAMVAGLAFGIHPLHAEPVAWATDRGDVLCAAFYLLAVLGYCRSVEDGKGLRWRPWGVLSLAAMAAAVLSKEIAVTLPAALLILDAYPLKRPESWPRRFSEKLPFIALALAGAVVAVIARAAGANFSTFEQYGAGGRIALFVYSLWYYAAAFVAPFGLAPYHEAPRDVSLLIPAFFVAVAGVVAVTIVVVLLRRRWPGAIAAWAYYVAVLLPVSDLVHSGSHLVAERYAYLPTIGFAILLGGGAAALVRGWQTGAARQWAPALLVGTMLMLGGWTVVAWRHSASWHDTLTMWQVSADADPSCGLCAVNLAAAYFNAGHPAEAEAWSRRAVELWPGRGTPHHKLGAALLAQHRNAEAERELLEAVRLAPKLAEAHRELGRLYARAGRAGEATSALKQALALGAPRAEVDGLLRRIEGWSPPALRTP